MVRINPEFRNQAVNSIPQLPFSMKSSYIEQIANCSDYNTVDKHKQVFNNIYDNLKGSLDKVKQSVKSLKSEKSKKKEKVYNQNEPVREFSIESQEFQSHKISASSGYSSNSQHLKKMKNYHSSNTHCTL